MAQIVIVYHARAGGRWSRRRRKRQGAFHQPHASEGDPDAASPGQALSAQAQHRQQDERVHRALCLWFGRWDASVVLMVPEMPGTARN